MVSAWKDCKGRQAEKLDEVEFEYTLDYVRRRKAPWRLWFDSSTPWDEQ